MLVQSWCVQKRLIQYSVFTKFDMFPFYVQHGGLPLIMDQICLKTEGKNRQRRISQNTHVNTIGP
jgi:hypothetical protein